MKSLEDLQRAEMGRRIWGIALSCQVQVDGDVVASTG